MSRWFAGSVKDGKFILMSQNYAHLFCEPVIVIAPVSEAAVVMVELEEDDDGFMKGPPKNIEIIGSNESSVAELFEAINHTRDSTME